MKIIIAAGADRTGKSTLTDEFVKHGFIYKHFGPPRGSAYMEYLRFAEWLRENGRPDAKYIVDRYMYCEFAYSKHYNRGTDMDFDRMHEIEDILLELDPSATVVYCSTDIKSNWKRIEDEGKREFNDIGQLDALRNEYKRVLIHSKLKIVEYDFTQGMTPRDIVSELDR